MNGDLISRSAFIEFIRNLPKTENGYSREYDESDIIHYINNQPTAYDVEKVVDEIKKESAWYRGFLRIHTEEAIDIVRSGGVE